MRWQNSLKNEQRVCETGLRNNRKATGLVFAGLPVTHTFLELLSFRSISIVSVSEAHSKIVRETMRACQRRLAGNMVGFLHFTQATKGDDRR